MNALISAIFRSVMTVCPHPLWHKYHEAPGTGSIGTVQLVRCNWCGARGHLTEGARPHWSNVQFE